MGTIKVAMMSMGFTRANERTDICGSCNHYEEVFMERSPPWDKSYVMCKKGGFKVTKMAICKQHKPKGAL